VKLGIIMLVIGFLGTLFTFLPAVEMADADIYSNPWVLVAGIVFFIIFLFGLFRFTKAMRRIGEERYRRK
jgi:ABC-type multidrug transport system permease subunit